MEKNVKCPKCGGRIEFVQHSFMVKYYNVKMVDGELIPSKRSNSPSRIEDDHYNYCCKECFQEYDYKMNEINN